MSNIIYAAIHIITESSDHYNLLVVMNDITNVKSITNELEASVSESPEYWSSYYVTTDSGYFEEDIRNIIQNLIDSYIYPSCL